MTWLALPAVLSAVYWLLAIVAALRFRTHAGAQAAQLPPVSILKPVHGRDPRFYEAIRSHALLDYPAFEILFGVSDPQDAAIPDMERLAAEFPARRIALLRVPTEAPNRKAGVLAALAAEARFPILLVNDSDIQVEPGYLRVVVTTLQEPGIGLATCLYRATGATRPARWEALGIATEFTPSVLVARLLGQAEFALGSTMAVRAKDVERSGGFQAIEEYLADDYQLGCRIRSLGYRIAFAPVVVETRLDAGTWTEAWRHQVRWSRTIRASRPGGYLGYAVTQATLWSLVALVAGDWRIAAGTLALRLAGGAVAAGVLGARVNYLLIPIRDLWGSAVWLAGLFGKTVYWRGRRLRLERSGRIVHEHRARG